MIDENVWYTDDAEMTDSDRDWLLGRGDYDAPCGPWGELVVYSTHTRPVESPTGALLFPGALLAQLAEILVSDNDGYIEMAPDHDTTGDVLMWIEGTAYTLAPMAS